MHNQIELGGLCAISAPKIRQNDRQRHNNQNSALLAALLHSPHRLKESPQSHLQILTIGGSG